VCTNISKTARNALFIFGCVACSLPARCRGSRQAQAPCSFGTNQIIMTRLG